MLQISNRQHRSYNWREQKQRNVRIRSSQYNMSGISAGFVRRWWCREVHHLQRKSIFTIFILMIYRCVY